MSRTRIVGTVHTCIHTICIIIRVVKPFCGKSADVRYNDALPEEYTVSDNGLQGRRKDELTQRPSGGFLWTAHTYTICAVKTCKKYFLPGKVEGYITVGIFFFLTSETREIKGKKRFFPFIFFFCFVSFADARSHTTHILYVIYLRTALWRSAR